MTEVLYESASEKKTERLLLVLEEGSSCKVGWYLI